ncbi:MAG: methyl-accepting chemotaxis sensory transducer [Puniceicoccaceae bacterium 5H]|nr:MAG: methyl-accepting chemotaxis sensory transducer [Puniceicoccaceae bacterium 5H]
MPSTWPGKWLREAARVTDEIRQAATTARGAASVIGGLRESGDVPERAVVSTMLRRLLEDNPDVMDVWAVMEPNALDGRDAAHASAPGSDAAGRYVPLWTRVGGVHLDVCKGQSEPSPASDFYTRPLESGQEVLMEPIVYPIAGKDVMVVSYCVPIRAGDEIIGVAGVDFSMDAFQAMVGSIELPDGAYGFLVASDQLLVSYPQEEALGKNAANFIQNASLLTQLEKGAELQDTAPSALDGSASLLIGEPVAHDGGAPWMLGIVTPERHALADAVAIRNLCILVGLIACGLVIALLWVMASRISAPLSRLAQEMRRFADQLAHTGQEVLSAGNTMAQGASESAAAIEETSASVEEITSMVERNAENSESANDAMKNTAQLVTGTTKSMQQLSESMQQITEASQQTQKIVKTIDEIAFQTNLLALNAAVEAARAGNAGAGFAVVAEEVRSLAQRAAVAARDTSSMIEESVRKIGNAAKVTAHTESEFKQVDEASGQTTLFITQIAEASREQRTGVAEISKAMNELSKVVQQNAAVAEESAATAQEMETQAARLQTYALDLSSIITGGAKQQPRKQAKSRQEPPSRPAPQPEEDWDAAPVTRRAQPQYAAAGETSL